MPAFSQSSALDCVMVSGFASRVTSKSFFNSKCFETLFINSLITLASSKDGVPPPKNMVSTVNSSTKIFLAKIVSFIAD